MLLALDIGNTKILLGIFNGRKLICSNKISSDIRGTSGQYSSEISRIIRQAKVNPRQIKGVIISSVVPALNPVFKNVFLHWLKLKPLFISARLKTIVNIKCSNPLEVGADRIAVAAGAWRNYNRKALIVVDFGTAVTFDVVNKKGDYLGGVIAPGIEISSIALSEKTALLPLIKIKKPLRVVGRTTVGCIEAGVYYGFIGMVKEIIERIKRETGFKPVIIATGGYAGFIAKELSLIDRVHPALILEGMRLIWEENMG
jgi:type III pantothenate kinase